MTSRRTSSEWAFVALVVTTVLIGFGAYASIIALRASLLGAVDARTALASIQASMLDAETGVRGYSATGERLFLQPYNEAQRAYPAELEQLRDALRRSHAAPLGPLVDQYGAARARWQRSVLVPLVNGHPNAPTARALQREGKRDVDAMRVQIAQLDAALEGAIAGNSDQVQASIGLAIALIVLMACFLGAIAIRVERQRAATQASLYAQLDQRAAELERSNQSLQEFAYVASHDLQEPLRTVASFAQLLDRRYRDKLDGEAGEFITFIVDGATRMQQLVADVLAYSRVTTTGKAFDPLDLNAAFEHARANLRSMISERGALVTAHELRTVSGDPVQLAQVLQNLIGNAIKYNSSPQPAVTVSSSRAGNEVTVRVSDNGIGIAPQYFERIFGLFQRLHGRGEYSGTGIGLALCKRIVERHGGRIWVESVEGHGTTFFFTLRAAEDPA